MKLMRLHVFAAMALTGLSGCFPAYPAAEGTFERTLDVTAPVSLEVMTGSGKIEIRAGSSDVVRVYALVRAHDDGNASAEEKLRYIQSNPPIEQTGNAIKIGRIKEDNYRNVSISYEIVTPAETRVVAKSGSGSQRMEGLRDSVETGTGSGSISILDIGGDVNARAGSGSIEADSVNGRIDFQTGSGSIRATRIAGSAKASTGSGTIKIDQAPAEAGSILDLEAHTGSGSIHISGVTGSLRASTGSGGIDANGRPGADWNLNTSSGSVSLIIPQDTSFDLKAATSSGRINVDHPVTVKGSVSRRELMGTVRGGGRIVAVQTGSGSITIR